MQKAIFFVRFATFDGMFEKIAYVLLLGACKAAGRLPYAVLYKGLAPAIAFFLYRIGRYRLGVVRGNLRNAFPEKTEAERRAIERKFYRQLAELFVDTIALMSISERQMRARFQYRNAVPEPGSWICAMAHYGSWEYTVGYPLVADQRVGAVYRPLKNRVFDRFYTHLRTRFGAIPVAMDDVAREMIRTEKEGLKPLVLALIADQSPHWFTIRRWFDFLHQPTGFFPGMEKLALKFHLPVYFLAVEKVKPGYYAASFEKIYDGTEGVAEHEITARYAARLERQIRERPELWLWSHRRWKHSPKTVRR